MILMCKIFNTFYIYFIEEKKLLYY